MKRSSRTVGGILLVVLMMTGCGEAKVPDTIDRPMISIAKSGEVTEYLVGGIEGKGYYDVSELSSMAAEEAAQYNTGHQTGTTAPVKLEKVEALPSGTGDVCVVYRYDSAESYTGFKSFTSLDGGSLFYGTLEEAESQGYSIDVDLVSAGSRDGGILTRDQVKQAADRQLIIAPAGVNVYCPGRVEYISGNAVMAEDGSVDTTTADSPVYILLK